MILTKDDDEDVLAKVNLLQPAGAGGWRHGYHRPILILDVGHHGNLVLPAWQEVSHAN